MERPTVLINFAISADGKIGTVAKGPSRFTSRADLDRLLAIRTRADALLVGRGTLEADEMSMTIPEDKNPTKQPLRCIVSRSGQFDFSHKVFQTDGGHIHLIVTEPTQEVRAPDSVTVHHKSLANFLFDAKSQLGVETLLCEGGGTLVHELFRLDVVDEINLTVAGHTLIGGAQAPTITGLPKSFLPTSRHYQIDHFEPTEEDELFATWIRQPETTSPAAANTP